MPKNYPRSDRVEHLARDVLSDALRELKDPRIGFATITSVKITPDLRTARVYVSVLGDPDTRATTMEGIQSAAPHLRTVLGHEIRLKRVPFIEVIEDQTAEQGERIEQLLRGLGVSKPPEVERLDDADDA
ncbi:MAG: 30S ribosome-binding factor RbfA [Actinomycetota bacterium]